MEREAYKKNDKMSFIEREALANWIRRGMTSDRDFLRGMTDQETAERYTKETGSHATREHVGNTRKMLGIAKQRARVQKPKTQVGGRSETKTTFYCQACGHPHEMELRFVQAALDKSLS